MVFMTNFPPPTEGVQMTQQNTAAHVGKREYGNGTLYIAESHLSWVADGGLGFSMEYVAISIHAVSKAQAVFPHDCLYLQLACKLDDEEEKKEGENSDSGEDEDDEYPVTEVRFVPQDAEKLKDMYDAMCHCQSLHRDPDDSNSEDSTEEFEEGDDFYGEDPDTEFITIENQAAFERIENMLSGDPAAGDADGNANNSENVESMETGQFEDANNEEMQ